MALTMSAISFRRSPRNPRLKPPERRERVGAGLVHSRSGAARVRRRGLRAALLGAAVLAGAVAAGAVAPLQAQDARAARSLADSAERERRGAGWLGLLAEAASPNWAPNGFVVRITDLHLGGPAQRSGLRPGDFVIAVNGARLSGAGDWLAAVSSLEPGAALRLGVLRGEQSTDVTVVAEARPGAASAPAGLARLDSIQSLMARRVDSIFQAMTSRSALDSAFRAMQDPGRRVLAAEARIRIQWSRSGEQAARTLTVQAEAARAETAQAEAMPGAPAREAAPPGRAEAEASAEAQERERRRVLAEETHSPPIAGGAGAGGARPNRDSGGFYVVTPFILEAPVVLGGAQVRDLGTELGRYFGLQAGVLVTGVARGSAAARAGFRAGDVIVAVAGEEALSVDALRDALAGAARPFAVRVVRDGQVVELAYPPDYS